MNERANKMAVTTFERGNEVRIVGVMEEDFRGMVGVITSVGPEEMQYGKPVPNISVRIDGSLQAVRADELVLVDA
jgi:hypothetical protein